MKIDRKHRVSDHNYLLKVVFSFIIAYLIVDQGEKLDLDTLNKDFEQALFINSLMIYMLISIISNFTNVLDRNCPWQKNYKKRIFLQLLLGVFMPLLPGIVFVIFYFSFHGIAILNTAFFRMYLQQLLMALLCINIYLYKKNRSNITTSAPYIKPVQEL